MITDSRYGERKVSQSLVESYLKCGLMARFQYFDGLRFINSRMAIGTGVSVAAMNDNLAKRNGEYGLPLGDLRDIAVSAYEEEIGSHETTESKNDLKNGKDSVADAALCYGRLASPKIKNVLLAEDKIEVGLPRVKMEFVAPGETRMVAVPGEVIHYVGTPDVVTSEGVGDTKTGKLWTPAMANRARQLTAYGLLHQGRYKKFPQRVWIDSVHRTKTGWGHERRWSCRSPENYKGFIYILNTAVDGMEKGIFHAAPEAGWWCSAKWCPFWKMCPAMGR